MSKEKSKSSRVPEIECKACGATHTEGFWCTARLDNLARETKAIGQELDRIDTKRIDPALERIGDLERHAGALEKQMGEQVSKADVSVRSAIATQLEGLDKRLSSLSSLGQGVTHLEGRVMERVDEVRRLVDVHERDSGRLIDHVREVEKRVEAMEKTRDSLGMDHIKALSERIGDLEQQGTVVAVADGEELAERISKLEKEVPQYSAMWNKVVGTEERIGTAEADVIAMKRDVASVKGKLRDVASAKTVAALGKGLEDASSRVKELGKVVGSVHERQDRIDDVNQGIRMAVNFLQEQADMPEQQEFMLSDLLDLSDLLSYIGDHIQDNRLRVVCTIEED